APLAGHGWQDAIHAAMPYMTVGHPSQRGGLELVHLHNDVLQFAVAFGLFGIIAYGLALCAPLVAWARTGFRECGYGSYVAFAVVLSFLVMGLTNTNFVFEPPKVMFCFAAAVAAALAARQSADDSSVEDVARDHRSRTSANSRS